MVSFTRGSVRTSPTALSMSAVLDPGRLHYRCCVESHRGQSWGRYSSIYSRSGTAGGILWTVFTLTRRQHPDLRLLSTRGHWQSTETCCWLCCCHRWFDAFQSTSAQCIQDGSTVVHFSLSTKSATFRSIGCWLWSRVACQICARSQYFHWRWLDYTYQSQSDMFEVFCCSSTTTKHTPITAPQLLSVFRSNSWTGFSLCRTPLHGWSSKLVVMTTFSRYCAAYTGFGCQNAFRSGWQYKCIAVSVALHLPTWLQIFSACHTSTHVSDCAFHLHRCWSLHALCVLPLATAPFQRLLHRSGTVCRGQSSHRCHCKFSAADWNRTFCPVLQSWLRTSRCTDNYYVTSLFKLIVTCP